MIRMKESIFSSFFLLLDTGTSIYLKKYIYTVKNLRTSNIFYSYIVINSTYVFLSLIS